jgi:3' terminal RNA ribose 2'-O-methyltransferase Hen1
MLLTITTTHAPATDLGYLLHKHPDRHHAVELSFGSAHVVYPEATADRCTAAVLVDVDPIGLVRGRKGSAGNDFALADYVNDRPYAASSFLSVALARLFGTAMSGRSSERQELADTSIPLEVSCPAVPVRGGEPLLRRLFEPLGYGVEATPVPLDPHFPAWGDSRYLTVTLRATARVKDLLEHLFVLLPVLDDDKHYWVGADEVDKLIRRAGAWLGAHPEREVISSRYLRHDRRLTSQALARLVSEEANDPDEIAEQRDAEEEAVEKPLSLAEQRIAAVVDAIEQAGSRRVVDLGCGSGKLVEALLKRTGIDLVLGVDVSCRALEIAARRLHLDQMPPRQRARVELVQGALTYRDRRLEGFDAAALVEVVEHLDASRLAAFERAVFAHARPTSVVVTTPNAEYNPLFPTLPAGSMRHRDHRFEWTRQEFASWTAQIAERHAYRVVISGIGPDDERAGAPTQMAVFSR